MLFAIIFVFALFIVNTSADSGSSLDQTVPFGITGSKDGQFIPVFDGVGSKNKKDLLLPGQLCALDYARLESSHYWYHIVYLDDEGIACDGYVKENNFEQLTVTGLAKLVSQSEEYAELIEQYTELAEISPLFLEGTVENRGSSSKGQHYILNTNTMKFHYPDCKSVKQMKEKNKKDFTGDRQELIDVGYVPCKNCNP